MTTRANPPQQTRADPPEQPERGGKTNDALNDATNGAACILLTRGSPLARKQAEISVQVLADANPPRRVVQKIIVTTGDKQLAWALEKAGGKGLFTSELESELLDGSGDIAVHSAKDLPAALAPGTALAGFLPRANAADVLVRRADVATPRRIATGSPRRRTQATQFFPAAEFCELRGNVATRLEKVAAGAADATFLAAAGLERLGIAEWPGLIFEEWGPDKMVPAAGQAAIAWQTRAADAPVFAPLCDSATGAAVAVERAFLAKLGEGCHSAFAAHCRVGTLLLFHESFGRRVFDFDTACANDAGALTERITAVLKKL
ncbi:MAG: hydroxymethylbilane synthase [Puniceicoccales bacterium]|jgi:hydroxymethylbilane synthase|nr:hydroxymethylbilane synthase [Puniceicoccales bacterium]